jgi:sensor histidine kinase regulating citrate/malate metabolism
MWIKWSKSGQREELIRDSSNPFSTKKKGRGLDFKLAKKLVEVRVGYIGVLGNPDIGVALGVVIPII